MKILFISPDIDSGGAENVLFNIAKSNNKIICINDIEHSFNGLESKIIRAERINTHGGSLRIYVKKDKNSNKTLKNL